MSPEQNEVEQIEIERAEAERLVDLRDSLDRLQKNRDFKKVILDGYVKNEPTRLAQALADPTVFEFAEHIEKQIHSIGWFCAYLRTIRQAAGQAENALAELRRYEAELDDAAVEEGV